MEVYYNDGVLHGTLRSLFDDVLFFNSASACGAGVDIFSFDTNGDMYPCMGMIGDDKSKLGEVNSFNPSDFSNEPLYKQLKENTPSKCQTCWQKNKCTNGGCYVENLFYSGKWHQPSNVTCQFLYATIECKIYFISILSTQQKEDIFSLMYTTDK